MRPNGLISPAHARHERVCFDACSLGAHVCAMRHILLSTFLLGGVALGPPPALAQTALAVQVTAGAMNQDASRSDVLVGLGYRVRLASGTQLGVDVQAAVGQEGRIGGFAAEDTTEFQALAVALWPLLQNGALDLGIRTAVGPRFVTADDDSLVDDSGTILYSEFGPIANVTVSDRWLVRSGFVVPVAFELSPTSELAETGALLLLGASAQVATATDVFADFSTGGLFGFGGDGTKFLARGVVGVRTRFGASSQQWRSF